MKKSLLTMALIACFYCGSCQQGKNIFQGTGWVVAKTATRGTQQYLIFLEDHWYFPEELPENFKKDSLKVQVKYQILDKVDTVYKPAPNDLLEFDFTAKVIRVKKIKVKEKR